MQGSSVKTREKKWFEKKLEKLFPKLIGFRARRKWSNFFLDMEQWNFKDEKVLGTIKTPNSQDERATLFFWIINKNDAHSPITNRGILGLEVLVEKSQKNDPIQTEERKMEGKKTEKVRTREKKREKSFWSEGECAEKISIGGFGLRRKYVYSLNGLVCWKNNSLLRYFFERCSSRVPYRKKYSTVCICMY